LRSIICCSVVWSTLSVIMKSNRLRFLLFLLALPATFCCTRVAAQNGINSPYSRYGLGLMSEQSTGMFRAMGGTGTALRLPNAINMANPASYSTVDTLTFLADFGLSIHNGNFVENGLRVNAGNAKFEYAAMQFRIQPKIGMTIAMTPFSNVGYNFSESGTIMDPMDGNISYTNTFTGYGGIRNFTAGWGWRATRWASLGAGIGLVTGDITKTTSTSFSETTVSSKSVTTESSLAGFDWNVGFQTQTKLFKGNLILGATFAPAIDLNGESTRVSVLSGSNVETQSDTVSYTGGFGLPERIKVGLSYSLKKVVLAADASYQAWGGTAMNGAGEGSDRMRYSVGMAYSPDEYSKKFLRRCTYNFGAYYQSPYFVMDNGRKGPQEFGLSAGMTLPFELAYNSMTLVHLTGSYARVQPSASGMISENYLMFTLGVSFRERWFMKWLVE